MKSIDQATADYATLLVNLATQLMSATGPCQCSDTSNCAADFATALITEARRQLLPEPPEPAKETKPTDVHVEVEISDLNDTTRVYRPTQAECSGCSTRSAHTTDCKFEHFLTYSGHDGSAPEVKALLRQGFDAAL